MTTASASAARHEGAPDFARFAIGFDERDRARFHALIDEVIDSGQWSHGAMNRRFEEAWSAWNGAPAVALGSWAGGAIAALEYAGVRGEAVLCPSNTFMATPLAIMAAGGRPVFVDCNRDDLCASLAGIEQAIAQHRPRACVLVHIGGHIAFESEAIAAACRAHDVFLLEDCAHAHGADWNGKRPATFGDAGVYSFYATKTVSTGEGGVLVSKDDDLIAYARAFRDYGKPDYDVPGVNFRMSEFTAAMGLIQTERLPEIVAWKNAAARDQFDALHPGRLQMPDGMTSGLYKYIVFDPIEKSSGKVYDQPCHRIMGTGDELPNTDWVAEGHWCVPLYYRPEVDPA
jgi:dTDP-4-amino-4,6-dideoxygalactose transaminase